MTTIFRTTAVLVLGLALGQGLKAWGGDPPREWIPLAKGNFWVYEGPTKWMDPNATVPQEKVLRRRMEVLDVITRGQVTAAVLKGHPLDLAFYQTGKAPADWLLIRAGGKYFRLDEKRAQDALRRLRDESDSLQGLVKEGDLILDTPLAGETVFGEAEMITRQDGWYCWNVAGPEDYDLKAVKGWTGPARLPKYTLEYRSTGGLLTVGLAPGVGWVTLESFHAGTPAETSLTLVECSLK